MDSKIVKTKSIPSPRLNNAVCLTVDVEDYFMSPETIRFEDWPAFQSFIHIGMERCLALFDEYNAHATFFFVGWLAERYPEIVQWTVERGHEIGTHTYNHTFVSDLDESRFADSIQLSLEILRDLAPNQAIIGHRAPAFSLDRRKPWQFAVLQRNGLLYDSSINPHSTYLYGDGAASRHPYWLHGLLEIPPAAIEFAGRRWPVGGGGTLRILPAPYLAWARRRYAQEGYPPVIHIHPWEFVPEHPRLNLPFIPRLIHWWGINTVERKLRAILERYSTLSMRSYYERIAASVTDVETSEVTNRSIYS